MIPVFHPHLSLAHISFYQRQPLWLVSYGCLFLICLVVACALTGPSAPRLCVWEHSASGSRYLANSKHRPLCLDPAGRQFSCSYSVSVQDM